MKYIHSNKKHFRITKNISNLLQDCSICFEKIFSQGVLKKCQHNFCFSCISKWSKEKNQCPVCKRTFSNIYKIQLQFDKSKNKTNNEKESNLNKLNFKTHKKLRASLILKQKVKQVVNQSQQNHQLENLLRRIREMTTILSETVKNFSFVINTSNVILLNHFNNHTIQPLHMFPSIFNMLQANNVNLNSWQFLRMITNRLYGGSNFM